MEIQLVKENNSCEILIVARSPSLCMVSKPRETKQVQFESIEQQLRSIRERIQQLREEIEDLSHVLYETKE